MLVCLAVRRQSPATGNHVMGSAACWSDQFFDLRGPELRPVPSNFCGLLSTTVPFGILRESTFCWRTIHTQVPQILSHLVLRHVADAVCIAELRSIQLCIPCFIRPCTTRPIPHGNPIPLPPTATPCSLFPQSDSLAHF